MASLGVSSTSPQKPSRKVSYKQQFDEDDELDENTQQGYMMLLPVRKKPVGQLFVAFAAMILAIAALSHDEIMDGRITYSTTNYVTSVKEVDYVCGYQQLRITYKLSQGYKTSTSYTYNSFLCTDNVLTTSFCTEQRSNGKIWLACGIVGILFNAVSLIAVYKQGFRSTIYLALITLSALFYFISSFNYLANERCSDLETYSNETVSLNTFLGASLILMMVAGGLCVLGTLLSLAYFIKIYKRNKESNDFSSSTVNTNQIEAR